MGAGQVNKAEELLRRPHIRRLYTSNATSFVFDREQLTDAIIKAIEQPKEKQEERSRFARQEIGPNWGRAAQVMGVQIALFING